jgi:putative hydrolase of the HAD superfamily
MTAAPSAIRCILFDLGSTLWEHGEPAVIRREKQVVEAHAGATLRALLAPETVTWEDAAYGHDLRQLVLCGIRAAHSTDPLLEPDFAALTQDILQSLGHTRADTRWGRVIYEALRVRSVRTRVLFPDVLSTLIVLRQGGYKLGIVTNRAYGGSIFLDDLRQLGLLSFFDQRHIAISADLGYRKPHSALFLHALSELGCATHETAMVGDQLGADVYGASLLGMFSIWRPHPAETEKPSLVTPDAVIGQIADLLALFA